MATTGYQAGVESNAVLYSYVAEVTYGALPAAQFQAVRMTSESLSGSKTRNRPAELQSLEVSQAVTVQETATGAINFALSFGTFDDWLAGCLGNTWTANTTVVGIAADITLTTSTNVLSSTLTSKFTSVTAGQWIQLSGFTNSINNGVFRVQTKTDNSHLVLSGAYLNGTATPFVTETPTGALATVRFSTIMNGTTEQTFYLQKRLSATQFLRYPGCFMQTATISGGTGQFLNGNFSVLATQEVSATSDASTGAVLAAPTRPVMDPVSSFGGVFLNEAPLGAVMDSFSLTITNTGSNLEYGMGSAAAQGFLAGLMQVTGTMKLYFNSLTLYANFKSEAQGRLSFKCGDKFGNMYVITLLNAALMNPQVQAGTQNSAVFASFTIEGNPQAAGGTIQIDRFLVV